jgi:hypothetical protein
VLCTIYPWPTPKKPLPFLNVSLDAQLIYDYSTFGLHLRSEIEIHEFGRVISGLEDVLRPDIEIAVGPMPDSVDHLAPLGAHMAISSSAALFRVPDVARYLVEEGRRVLIEPLHDASSLEVRAYLLGTALGALLHQRRMIPLHVSVVASPRGLLAFSGPSGAGKSTIAAALHLEHGWPILTDDLAVMDGPSDAPRLRFGVRRLRLWKDAIAELGVTSEPKSRVIDREDKFQFDLVEEVAAGRDHTLRAIFLLANSAPFSVAPIRGGPALIAFGHCIYRPGLAALFNDMNGVLSALAGASNAVQINTLNRPIPDLSASQVASRIVEWSGEFGETGESIA